MRPINQSLGSLSLHQFHIHSMFARHLFFVYCRNAVAEIRFASEGIEKREERYRNAWKTTKQYAHRHNGMDTQTEYFIANIKYRYRLIQPNIQ